MWLKQHNDPYAKILLPSCPQDLIHNFTELDIEYKINDYQNTNVIDFLIKDTKAALLTQKEQSDEYYADYRIYPLHNKLNQRD